MIKILLFYLIQFFNLIQVYRLFSGIDRLDANVFFSLHNEDEAGSVRAETRGHPRKILKSRYVRRLGKDSFAFRVVTLGTSSL